MNPIVIIGTGLAGYNTAKELRKLNQDTPLVILTADSGHFYSKPMLSSAFASGKAPAQLAMNTPEQMAVQLAATVRPGTRVTAIDTAAHIVCIGEEKLGCSKLVLALGADRAVISRHYSLNVSGKCSRIARSRFVGCGVVSSAQSQSCTNWGVLHHWQVAGDVTWHVCRSHDH